MFRTLWSFLRPHVTRRERHANAPRRRFRPVLDTLENRITPTVNYIGPNNGNWDVAQNWFDTVTSTQHVPGVTDDVSIQDGKTVNLTNAVTVKILVMMGAGLKMDGAGQNVTVTNGGSFVSSTLTMGGNTFEMQSGTFWMLGTTWNATSATANVLVKAAAEVSLGGATFFCNVENWGTITADVGVGSMTFQQRPNSTDNLVLTNKAGASISFTANGGSIGWQPNDPMNQGTTHLKLENYGGLTIDTIAVGLPAIVTVAAEVHNYSGAGIHLLFGFLHFEDWDVSSPYEEYTVHNLEGGNIHLTASLSREPGAQDTQVMFRTFDQGFNSRGLLNNGNVYIEYPADVSDPTLLRSVFVAGNVTCDGSNSQIRFMNDNLQVSHNGTVMFKNNPLYSVRINHDTNRATCWYCNQWEFLGGDNGTLHATVTGASVPNRIYSVIVTIAGQIYGDFAAWAIGDLHHNHSGSVYWLFT